MTGEVLVKFSSQIGAELRQNVAESYGTAILSTIGELGVARLSVPGDVPTAVESLGESPWVEFAQPNYYAWRQGTSPNDPEYDDGQLISLNADQYDFQRWYLGPGLLNAEGA